MISQPLVPGEKSPIDLQPAENLTRLNQGFENDFESGWQAIDDLLAQSPACLNFLLRSPQTRGFSLSQDRAIFRRCKSIDFGIQVSSAPTILLVELRKSELNRVEVCLQVHPADGRAYLPPHVQFSVKDRTRQQRRQTQSRQADRYIQLRLVGDPGDRFSATRSLNDRSVAEEFAI